MFLINPEEAGMRLENYLQLSRALMINIHKYDSWVYVILIIIYLFLFFNYELLIIIY